MPDHLRNLREQLDADYASAQIHLSWAIKERRIVHVFGLIELLPIEVPPSPLFSPKSKPIGNSGWSLGYKRFSTSAIDGIDFFQACIEGKVLNFDAAGTLQRGKIASIELPLLDDPRFKVPESGLENQLPYLANWHICPRVYEGLPKVPLAFASIFSDIDHQDVARDWFSDFTHFDSKKFPEYIGGVVLVAPNPIFRSVDTRLSVNKMEPQKESVVIRVHPRQGQTSDGLKVICKEKDTGSLVEHVLSQNTAKLSFDHAIGEISEEIYCPHRGILFRTPPTGFIRSISARMSLKTAEIHQRVIDEVSGRTKEVISEKSESLPAITIGTSKAHPAQEAEMKRCQELDGMKYQQCWFGGSQQKTATDYVLGIIQSANKEVWIVDPYFGALDLSQYFFANSNWSVPIRILTSAAFLKKRRDREEPLTEEGDAILQFRDKLLESLQSRPGLGTPQVMIRVMAGEKSPIHDRFIVADTSIWMIGSSLNELGSRGTVTLRLPNPWSVLPVLKDEWQDAKDLTEWVHDRQKKRKEEVGLKVEVDLPTSDSWLGRCLRVICNVMCRKSKTDNDDKP
jgi:hypothetical protein